MEIKTNEDRILLFKSNGIRSLSWTLIEGDVYLSAWEHNGLFKIDKDGKAKLINLFKTNGKPYIHHEFSVNAKEKVWFIPTDYGDSIAVFNPSENNIQYIKIPQMEFAPIGRLFINGTYYDNKVILIPGNYDAILEYNADTFEAKRIPLNIEAELFKNNKSVFISGVLKNKEWIFLPWGYDRLVKYDMEKQEISESISIERETYRHIIEIEGKLYLLPRIFGKQSCLLIKQEENDISEIAVPTEIKGVCISAFNIRNCIFFLVDGENICWKWNVQDDTFEKIYIDVENALIEHELLFGEARKFADKYIVSTQYDYLTNIVFSENAYAVLDINKETDLFLKTLFFMMQTNSKDLVYEF